jgi:hypothetical protein
MAAACVVAPFLQGLVSAAVSYYLALPIGWTPILGLIVSPIPLGLCTALLAGYLIGRLSQGASQLTRRALLPQYGSPYYLEREHLERHAATPLDLP